MPNTWLSELVIQAAALTVRKTFWIEGLELRFWAQDEAFVNWVERYLFPLGQEPDDGMHPYTVKCLYADGVVANVVKEVLADQTPLTTVSGYGGRSLLVQAVEDKQVCLAAEDGVVWVVDRQERCVWLVYSSRTAWPALECARAARDVIAQFLSAKNWFLCHAGAVSTRAGNYMIVGDPGAGKTTLIFALLQIGARYLANDLLFAKATAQGLNVIPFPIPIALGLGTALQFPAMSPLLEPPYALSYPPRRLNARRLAETDRADWPALKDKLQILPFELATYYPAAAPMPHAMIDALMMPDIRFQPIAPEAALICEEDVTELLSDNIGNERFTAPWLDFGFNGEQSQDVAHLIERASVLPAVEVTYHASFGANPDESFASILKEIQDALT